MGSASRTPDPKRYEVIENDGTRMWSCATFDLEAHARFFARSMMREFPSASYAILDHNTGSWL